VRGRVTTNDGATLLRAALNGLGLVYLPEQTLLPHVERGALELVLEAHAVTVPGFFLYFPRTSAPQPKLRAFIDTARRLLPASPRQAGTAAGTGRRRSSNDRQMT
jgi:DNA-binding transcriptional LysR family regulator